MFIHYRLVYVRSMWLDKFDNCNYNFETLLDSYYFKNYLCYHIVALAIQEGLTQIPNRCQTLQIAAKKKR